jgi:chorismate mutase-like protein
VLALCAAAAAAQEPAASWTQIQQRGVLRVGTTGDYAPYSVRDAQARLAGADIALARELALGLGLRVEFVPTTWRSLQEDARARRFDVAIGGISDTPERRQYAYFSTAYVHDSKQPVVRCGEQKRYDTLGEIDAATVRLIVNPGGTNEAFARAQFPRAALSVYRDNLGVFEEIRAGRADVMVTDGVEAALQQRSGRGLCAVKVRGHWARAGKAVMLPQDPALRSAINAQLRALGGERAYARRLQAWLDDAGWAGQDAAKQLAALIDERLALGTEVARYKWNTGAAIEDPPREQALLASLRERGAVLGVPPSLVERFFAAQIEASKQLQRQLHQRWRGEHREKFPGIADLATAIRPGIDRVTSEMLEALARLDTARTVTLPAASTMTGISADTVRMAREPLLSPAS